MLVFFMLLGIIPTAFAEQPKASDVELLKHDITLAQNEEAHLYLKTTPAGGVEWKSSDDWVVEVNNRGDIQATGIGIAIVTVTSNDTGNSDQVRVTVTDHYVLYDSFDWGLDKWATYDYDGDGFTWIRASDYDEPVQAIGWDAALCASYYPANGDRLNSDDYLISTQFDIPADVKTAELRFAVGALDTYPEQLYIYMNKDVSNIDDLIDNMIYFESVDSDYMEVVVDLSEYIGWEDLTLAFNYYGNDQAGIWLDNAGIYIEYEKIDEIEITDADITPVAGDYAYEHLAYSLPSDAHYSVNEQIWWDYTNDIKLNGTFVAGNEYEAGWVVYVDEAGYEFSPECTITINGASEIDWDFTELSTDGNMYWIWTAPILCEGGGAELTVIPKIELLDVLLAAPEGELAGDYLTANVPSSANYAVSGVYWWDDTDERWVGNDETFTEGHSYSTQFYVKPNDGYKFDNTTELYINGSKDNVDLYYSDIMSDGKYEVWTYPVICGTDLADIPIELVDISGVFLDIHDGMRESECLGYKLNTTNCEVIEVVWFDDTIHDYLPSDGTFTEGHSYFIGIKLAANDGYCFTADTKAKLNGSAENVGDGYLYEDDFIVKSKLIVCGSQLDITIGDVNGDGKINTADAVVVLKYAAGMISLDNNQLVAGDTNHDGKVNTADAVLILKYAAGMITAF